LIKLSLPRDEAEHLYFVNRVNQHVIALNWRNFDNLITWRHDSDQLLQGAESFGEKDVYHEEVNAESSFIPALLDMVASPTSVYPDKVTWHHRQKSDGILRTVDVLFGMAYDGSVTVQDAGSFLYLNIFKYIDDLTYVVYVAAIYTVSDPRLYSVTKTTYSVSAISGTTVTIQRYQLAVYPQAVVGRAFKHWTRETDYLIMIDAMEELLGAVGGGSSQETTALATTKSPLVASLQPMKDAIDQFLVDNFNADNFPHEVKDFGILASEASLTLNANNVNMIAFFRDLRRPQEMIPKLLNLRKLKTHASNFLAIKYGVLPTVTDIQDIVEAFKSRLPHLDKYGFRTCSAGYRTSANSDGNIFELTQRIKIAVANDDSELIKLISRLESIGVFPTLENIWDLVPYSFVLDWFIDVGDFLQRADSHLRLMRFDVKYVTKSQKQHYIGKLIPSQTFPYIGTVEQVRYQRWTDGYCPVPPLFSLETPLTASDHWVESAAMLIQRRK